MDSDNQEREEYQEEYIIDEQGKMWGVNETQNQNKTLVKEKAAPSKVSSTGKAVVVGVVIGFVIGKFVF